jgi:pimeloyl-ACP methyl ester carboxylesterase
MKCLPVLSSPAAVAVVLLALAPAPAQEFKPPAGKQPSPEVLKQIADKTAQLDRALGKYRGGESDPLLPEVEIFHQAAVNIVKYREFFQPDAAKWTLEVLDRGLERVQQVEAKNFDWINKPGFTAVRAYRSRIDGSVQPYAVTLPEDYGKDPEKKWRIDVVLHGRDASLTEVKFLRNHGGGKAAPKGQQFVRIDIYGRGNNAYRWAGESDVLEVMAAFVNLEMLVKRDRHLDLKRWVLRGFSMGGAGTWHLGLHRPDNWCVIGPGAGFTTTHGYIGKLPPQLPDHQERCLRIYDAVDYAENAFMVPVVAYSGAKDPQKKAADNIEARLKKLALADRMQHLIAPDLEHKFPAEWQKKVEEAFTPFVAKGHDPYPPRVRFVTYTLKYPQCDWVGILNLERHYDRTEVDATKTEDGFQVTTANVRTLRLGVPKGLLHDVTVVIDKQTVTARPWGNKGGPFAVYLQKRQGKWASVLPERLDEQRARQPQKVPHLTGPIDDAFTDGFLCVRGTGKPWHAATDQYATDNLQRFRHEWGKYWRGKLPVKDDVDVTREDIMNKNLILFGDPSSNSLIAHALDGLPLQWTKDTITFAGQQVKAADHVPVLIYPNPLNHRRYLVLNSGHTFHAAEYQGTNAQLYPRLGDYALLRLAPTDNDALAVETVTAGLFDDDWRIGKR